MSRMGMKRTARAVALLAALCPLLTASAGSAAEGGLRYTIGVVEFDNESGYSWRWDLGHAWGTVLTDLLSQTGDFIVLGETEMRGAALSEQDLAASGRTAQGGKAPVTGQLTPAQLLVKGSITHVQVEGGGGGGLNVKGFRIGGRGESVSLKATMYIVDSTTGQVVASQSVEGTSKKRGGRFGYSGHGWSGDADAFKSDNVAKALEDAVSQGVDWMVEQLPSIPWTGTVIMVEDGQVYVNRGTREGVAPGQAFVVGEERVIRDPDTGEVLDRSVDEVARLECSTVKEKLSICNVVSGSAAAVERGMGVSLP